MYELLLLDRLEIKEESWPEAPWASDFAWERYRFKQHKLSIAQLAPRYVLEYYIKTICNVDVLSVYKNISTHSSYSKAKYKTYLHPHLLARPQHQLGPRWYRYVVAIFRTLAHYGLIRALYGYLIHLYQRSYNVEQVRKWSNLNIADRPATSHQQVLAMLDEPWGSALYIVGMTADVYIIAIGYICAIYPADGSIYRFMVDPWRELERIHLQVGRIVRGVLCTSYAVMQSVRIGRNSLQVIEHMNSLEDSCQAICRARWLCRPRVYSSEGFVNIHKMAISIFTFLMISGFSVYFSLLTMVVLRIGIAWHNLMLIFEIMIIHFTWLTAIVFSVAVVFLVTRYQTKYLVDLKSDIEACVRRVKLDNVKAGMCMRGFYTIDPKIDYELLRVLIKSNLCFEEIAHYQPLLRALVQCCTVLVLILLGLLLNSCRKQQQQQQQLFRVPMLVALVAWTLYNIFLLWCADYFARLHRASQAASGLLCEAQARANRLKRIHILCDFVESRWRKLVLSNALVGRHLAVQVFGAAVTFRQILELNYAAATVVAYLRIL